MRKLCLVAILASVFFFLNSNLSLADDMISIYKLAIEKDPQFKGAAYDRSALNEGLKQAYAHLYPEIHGEFEYARIYQDIVSSSNTVMNAGSSDYDSKTYTAKLTQSVFRYNLLVEVSQAEFLRKRADTDFEFAKQDLLLRVAHAYMQALASRESLAFARAERDDIQVMHERSEVRYNSGMASVTDLYDARARLASVNAQVIKAESDFRDSLQALQEICGRPVTSLNTLRDELPTVMPDPEDVDKWVKVALDQNLKIKSGKYDYDIANKEIVRQKSGQYPTLDMVGRYYRQDTGGSLFGGGSVVDTKDITLQLSVPLFEGGLILSKVREAEERARKSSEMLEKQKRAIVREVNASYDGVKSAISRTDALRKSIESQSVLLEAKEKGYKSGLYTSLTVLDAARDLYMYRRDYAQSRYDYVLNTLRLKQAVGILSESDLVVINGWLQ